MLLLPAVFSTSHWLFAFKTYYRIDKVFFLVFCFSFFFLFFFLVFSFFCKS